MPSSWVPARQVGANDATLTDFDDTGLHIANTMIVPTTTTADAFTIGTVGTLTGGIPVTINDTARFIACADTVS